MIQKIFAILPAGSHYLKNCAFYILFSYFLNPSQPFFFWAPSFLWKAQWFNGFCTGLRIKQSGFKPSLARRLRCVLGKTFYTHIASSHPGV